MAGSSVELIKSKIIELLSHMGFKAVVFERQEEGRTVFNIKTDDAQLLIGKQGLNLESLQHLVYLLLRKNPELEFFSFALDIDDYREKRAVYLKDLARRAAHQVRTSGRGVALPIMPAYERKVVHNYLSLFSDIFSQSSGDEPNRRIIIRKNNPDGKKEDEFVFIENS